MATIDWFLLPYMRFMLQVITHQAVTTRNHCSSMSPQGTHPAQDPRSNTGPIPTRPISLRATHTITGVLYYPYRGRNVTSVHGKSYDEEHVHVDDIGRGWCGYGSVPREAWVRGEVKPGGRQVLGGRPAPTNKGYFTCRIGCRNSSTRYW